MVFPGAAVAVDSRVEKAKQIREDLILKRRDQGVRGGSAAEAKGNPWAELVAAAEQRLAQVDAGIEEARRRREALAAPRDKLLARSDELAASIAKLQADNTARVEVIYRSAKLGAGAAGWHPDPARSARLSRYLAALAAEQQQRLNVVEVEQGSVIASLDRARAEDAAIADQLRVLDADRLEAAAGLDRAVEEARTGVSPGSLEALGRGGLETGAPGAPSEVEGQETSGATVAAAPSGAAQADGDFSWPAAEGAQVAPPATEDAEEVASADAAAAEAAAAKLAEAKAALLAAQNEQAEAEARAEAEAKAEAQAEASKAAAAAKAAAESEAKEKAQAEASAAASAPTPAAGAAPVPQEDEAPPGMVDGPAVLAPSLPPAAASAPEAAAEGSPEQGRRGFLSRMFGSEGASDSFAANKGKLPAPVAGKVVANYGQQHKSGATYRGAILRAGHDEPVKAVGEGKVSFVGNVPGLGNTVIVSHGGRYHTVYARLGSVAVKEGQGVGAGSRLGALPADNADMHFELRDRGKAIDPVPWLQGLPGAAP
ncbi:MAG: murein hydrolase activator EnvC [Candidatus Binatia bacterium]